MIILSNGLAISQDKYQWIVNKRRKNAKKNDEEYFTGMSYYANLKQLSKALVEMELREEEYETLEAILEKLKDFDDGIDISFIGERDDRK